VNVVARQDALPATASLKAFIDGAATHSWDVSGVLSLDGIVTVILEHVGVGKSPPAACARNKVSPRMTVVSPLQDSTCWLLKCSIHRAGMSPRRFL
jgi:hypothetical protein